MDNHSCEEPLGRTDCSTRSFFSASSKEEDGAYGKKTECLTLADIKRRAKREAEEARNDNYIKRFQMLNFSSEDNRQQSDVELRSYYCCICGHHSFVIEGEIGQLPVYHGYYVLPMTNIFSKIYVNPSEQVLIQMNGGVEWRVIHRCTQCQFQLAYRIRTGVVDDLLTEYTYIAKDSVVARQTDAAALLLPSK